MRIVSGSLSMFAPIFSSYLRRTTHSIEKDAYDTQSHQEKTLHKIIAECSTTEFGKKYGINQIHNLKDAKQLPITNYAMIREDIEKIYQLGSSAKGLMSWSPIKGFAVTTGTSGGQKIFPITKKHMASFVSAGLSMLATVATHSVHSKQLFSGKVLALCSNANGWLSPTGLQVCHISRFSALHTPNFANNFLIPSRSTILIPNSPEKINLILAEAKNQDIRAIIAFPLVLKRLLEVALSSYKVSYLNEIWPNLSVIIYGGNILSAADKRVVKQAILGKDAAIRDLEIYENYSAVEGFFGYSFSPQWPGMVFNLNDTFYQFKEFPDGKELLQLHELENSKYYAIFVTTINGLVNYEMGDVIQITSIKPLTFKFVSRTVEQISLISEKLILDDFVSALHEVSVVTSQPITDFVVWVERGKSNRLVFGVSVKNATTDFQNSAPAIIDSHLREINSYYDDYRNSHFYELPILKIIPESVFSDYRGKKVALGFHKEKRIFPDQQAFEQEYLS